MAVFLEKEQDRRKVAIPAARVEPDLVAKLPGLFGHEAPINSVRAALFATEKTAYFPRRTVYPIDYVAVHAETGAPMDGMDVQAHTRHHRGLDWQTDVRASLNGEPGFEAWWEGAARDPNSSRLSFRWEDAMPTIMIESRRGFLFSGPEVKAPPIGMVEFMKKRGKGRRWLREMFAGYPVELEDLDIHVGNNVLSATLRPRDAGRQPFFLRLPLVLQTNLKDGVPGELTRG